MESATSPSIIVFRSPNFLMATGTSSRNPILAKMLSPARCNLFGQLSYPFTPLFSGSFSGMLNPSDGSSYLGPSFTYSLGNNLELMATGQLFFGDEGTEYGELGKAVYGRLKWAF